MDAPYPEKHNIHTIHNIYTNCNTSRGNTYRYVTYRRAVQLMTMRWVKCESA